MPGAPAVTRLATARLAANDLLEAYDDLAGQITIRHVTEEMDSQGYLGRVASGFSRLDRTAQTLAARIAGNPGNGRKQAGMMTQVDRMRMLVTGNVRTEWLQEFPHHREAFERLMSRLDQISNLLTSFQTLAARDLGRFCGESNRAHVREVTVAPARRSEWLGGASLVALLTAVLGVMLSNWAITQSGSFHLMENRAVILLLAFAAMLLIAWLPAALYRRRQINALRQRMDQAFARLLTLGMIGRRRGILTRIMHTLMPGPMGRAPARAPEPAFDSGGRMPDFDLSLFGDAPVRPSDGDQSANFVARRRMGLPRGALHKALMVTVNLLAIAVIPFALAYLGRDPFSKDFHDRHFLIGRGADGHACLIGEGNLVRVTDRHLTLQRGEASSPTGTRADLVVDRARVERIEQLDPTHYFGSAETWDSCDRGRSDGPVARANHHWSILENFGRGVGQPAYGPVITELSQRLVEGFEAINGSLARLAETRGPDIPAVILYVPQFQPLGPPIVPIFVDGEPVALAGAPNAMLLPLFRAPVRGIEGAGPGGAYAFGRASLRNVTEDGARVATFLNAILQPIRQCAAAGATVDLDVVGFASNSWSQPGAHDAALLNLQLAEGRRAAVLDHLWAGLDDAATASRIRIMGMNGVLTRLDQMMSADGPLPLRFETGEQGAAGAREMAEHLAAYVRDTPDLALADSLRELLSRSAVIRILAAAGSDCLVPPSDGSIADQTTAHAQVGSTPDVAR